MIQTDKDLQPNRRRRVIALSGVALAVLSAVAVISALPESLRVLLVGQTVEHCPDSELSCPSQQPGLLLLLVLPALFYEIVTEDEHDE